MERLLDIFDDDLIRRLRRIIGREERLPGWEDETGSDEQLSLIAHVRAQLADDDER